MNSTISRRSALGKITGGAALAVASAKLPRALGANEPAPGKLRGNINHSVCRWCYSKISLEDLCAASREIGLKSIDLLEVTEFPVLKKYGLICAMVTGVPGGIPHGLNRAANHDGIYKFFEKTLPIVADHGFPNIICFSGNRAGMDDQMGMENCLQGLKRIIPLAEKHGVNVCMELLNSKRNHKDYMCDHSAWGFELAKRAGSERFKLLYDIYHMQIMEGDLIATIQENPQYIGHYHTGGVPGRGEIDDTQEIFYPAVMRAIVKTGYKGYVAQEFVPKRPDALASLRECVHICDV